jgi:hypothetical protein
MDRLPKTPLSGLVEHAPEIDSMPQSAALEHITDEEIKKYAHKNFIRNIRVFRMPSGQFRVVVSLTFTPGDHLLITVRKTPREWVSLDRLMKHISANYGEISAFSLAIKLQPDKASPEG